MPKPAPVPFEISSDEETSTRTPRRRRNTAPRRSKPEAIVISSDDEDGGRGPFRFRYVGSTEGRPPKDGRRSAVGNEGLINDDSEEIAMYEARLESYELEVAKLRQRKEELAETASQAAATRFRMEDEVLQLKAELGMEKTVTHDDCRLFQALADITSCDICSERMSKPVTLDCGHTFCQPCVSSWFRTIEEQHKDLYPQYDPTTAVPAPDAALLRHLIPLNRVLLTEIAEENPRPPYTCPICRKAVGRPVECFKLRAVVDAVADAATAQMKSGSKSSSGIGFDI
ncbi:hypothetical protein EWM64_g6072 [Hericium alpestre]|uniref:RING-type domain-containing protein n=1 Tax=Hericium alpestre TaxID=135208 RepID=A0A4Y9ZWQ9_9AGAM|nr:hypothetical protein EWM64_g6072 [Hericium alpestre]